MDSSIKNARKDALVVEVSKSGDPEEAAKQAIRTFMKKVRNSGLVQELLRREHYEKPSVSKRKKHKKALRSKLNEEIS